MNKKIIWIIVILLIVVALFSTIFNQSNEQEEFKPLEKNIGDEFNEISYANQMFIVNYEIADITGDGNKDMIFLIGENTEGTNIANNIITNMDVVLYDTANEVFIKANSKNFNGKNNRIILGDFTGNGTLDIMILSESNGKIMTRIYTYEESNLKEIWKDRNNKGLVFNVEFLDGFKIKIVNKKLNVEKIFDISQSKEEYINNFIYDTSGKLIGDSKGIGETRFCKIEIIGLNDRSGVKATQKILGINENDILDEIEIVWKYQDGKWQIVEANGIKLGNLLY